MISMVFFFFTKLTRIYMKHMHHQLTQNVSPFFEVYNVTDMGDTQATVTRYSCWERMLDQRIQKCNAHTTAGSWRKMNRCPACMQVTLRLCLHQQSWTRRRIRVAVPSRVTVTIATIANTINGRVLTRTRVFKPVSNIWRRHRLKWTRTRRYFLSWNPRRSRSCLWIISLIERSEEFA